MLTRRALLQSTAVLPALSLWGCASLDHSDMAQQEHSPFSADSEWAGWEEKRFPGKRPTQYQLGADAGSDFSIVKARATGSASMLRKRMAIEAHELGNIRFTWRAQEISVDADVGDIDATDAPVRLVLAFEGDRGRWSAKDTMLNELSRLLMGEDMPYATLVYTWCARSPKHSIVNNPRTQTVRNLILESGSEKQGQWLSYRRNIREDFIKAFGEEPGRLSSMALMTDADNTKSRTEGWYRQIRIEKA